MSFQDFYNLTDEIKGMMTKLELKILSGYASQVEKGIIVEIGAWTGRSGKILALSSPTSQIISIDYFKNPYFAFHLGVLNAGEAYQECQKNMEGINNWQLIKEDTKKAGKNWEKEIDLLFIDGDHEYEGVKSDIQLFVPYVKSGHVVLFHDYVTSELPDVKRAVDELKDEYFKSFTTYEETSLGIGVKK